MQGKRYFNLTYRPKYLRDNTKEEHQDTTVTRIQRSVPSKQAEESPLGNFLIRLILCISVFSGILLMKNSTNMNVNAIYNVIRAWSVCNYSAPDEYGMEKLLQAIKHGDWSYMYASDIYPKLKFPMDGVISVNYGEKDKNGGTCFGIMLTSDTVCNIFSSMDGTVTDIGSNDIIGEYITIEADGGIKLIYGCCNAIMVSVGDNVDTDTVIAQPAKGEQNYFMYMELQINGKTVDPTICFNESGTSK